MPDRTQGLPLVLASLLLFAGSGLAAAQTLRLLTHDSFAVSDGVLAAFTAETGVEVQVLTLGDAGELVNRAILTKRAPLGDVLYGVDNSLLARAAAEGVFEPYRSPLLDAVAPEYRFDPDHLVTPIDAGFVTFNLDRAFFEEHGLRPPTDIAELTEARYRGLSVVANPASSSPGLAFMLATIDRFGEEGWLEYWAALRDNDLLVTEGWSDAYYTAFSLYGGDRPLVLSYASSPAAEVHFSEGALDEAPSANLLCDRCVFRQIEAAGILAGTEQREEAEALIDFMLSRAFQEDVPLTMFVYPVVEGAALPAVFERFSQRPTPEQVAELAPGEIDANLQRWLEQWTRVVLQGASPDALR